jgi:sugar-specific transcriptional regulator TrmB
MVSENKSKFASLIDLFDSIDVIEKGIEQVYDFLLKSKTVDDLKILVDSLGLNLKRVYKVTSVLKELGLIQIYNRPMKIQLLDPIKSWEDLLDIKIKEINKEAEEKADRCTISFSKMTQSYNLEKVQLQPVEFISYLGSIDMEAELFTLISKKEILGAKGVWYTYDYDRIFKDIDIPGEKKQSFVKIVTEIIPTKFKILISDDYFDSFKKSGLINNYKFVIPILEDLDVGSIDFDIRFTEEQFSSFIVRDKQTLIQPSFDPNDNLLGYFVSQPQEIVDIFYEKFNTLFKNAEPIQNKFKVEKSESVLYNFFLAL